MAKSVLVGMSGGVDSSVAAMLLMQAGYETSGVTLRLHDSQTEQQRLTKTCCSLSDVEDARSVCDRLNIRHYVFNFKERFDQQVIAKFVNEYKKGNTPNPCIDCNRYIKFDEMLKRAELLDIDYIATGHYAAIQKQNDRFLLVRPKDVSKDQTYVLYMLTQDQLAHTLMPLGNLTKSEVRELAGQNGFVNANKPDSQDICFVPDGKYADFIEDYSGHKLKQGDFVSTDGQVIGHHNGMERYTIGQRKGLGIGFGKPVYVVKKSAATNHVVLGDESDLYSGRVTVNDFNLIAANSLEDGFLCKGKLRYRQREEECRLHFIDNNTVIAEFKNPQRAVTLGQAAVFYSGDVVIGGGTISGAQ